MTGHFGRRKIITPLKNMHIYIYVSVCVFVYMNYIIYVVIHLPSDEFINIIPLHIFKGGGGKRNLYAQGFSFIKTLVFQYTHEDIKGKI